MAVPDNKNDFNKLNYRPSKEKAPTHEQLEQKFKVHKEVTDNARHKAQMDKYRNNYMDEKSKQESKEGMQLKHFKDGVNIGVHPKEGKEAVVNTHDKQREAIRKTSWKETKSYYKNNYSLEKNFNEKTRGKDDGPSKD